MLFRSLIAAGFAVLVLSGCNAVPEYLQPVLKRCGADGVIVYGRTAVQPDGEPLHMMACKPRD